MLHYAVVFLVIALIAAVFGFGGIAAGASVAKSIEPTLVNVSASVEVTYEITPQRSKPRARR